MGYVIMKIANHTRYVCLHDTTVKTIFMMSYSIPKVFKRKDDKI
jgi:hypothetical protein